MATVGLVTKDKYNRILFDSRNASSIRWLGEFHTDGRNAGSIVNQDLATGQFIVVLKKVDDLVCPEGAPVTYNTVIPYPYFEQNGDTLSWSYPYVAPGVAIYGRTYFYGVASL